MGFTRRRVVLRVAVVLLVWTDAIPVGQRVRRVPVRARVPLV